MRRKVAALAAAAVGVTLGGLIALRRALVHSRGRVDVYFADGSFVTSVEGSRGAARLLPLAREALAAARER